MERNEKQIRKLRELADKARQTGNTRKALEVYHELCQAEPGEPRWPQLCGELHRKLGQLTESLEHFVAAAQIYRSHGFDVKAVAMCKVVLGLDPLNSSGLNLLEAITASPQASAEATSPQPQARQATTLTSYPGMRPIQPTSAPQGRMIAPDTHGTAQAAGGRESIQARVPFEVETDPEPEDPFLPFGPSSSSQGFAASSDVSSPRAQPAPPPRAQPAPPPAREAAPGAPQPRRPSRETSPKELQALDLDELEALLVPNTGGLADREASVSKGGAGEAPADAASDSARTPLARTTLDLAIEIEGFDSVLGSTTTSPTTSGPFAAPLSPGPATTPRKRVQETITLSEDELEILESGAFRFDAEDDEAAIDPSGPPTPGPPGAAPTNVPPSVPLGRAPSEEELEILDDSDLAFMEALEKSTGGEQRQPKKRPTLDPNAPLESLLLKDVITRRDRLPSQPHMDELYEIELEAPEPEPEPVPVRSVEAYERRLTPANLQPDMTPPGLFRALGIDATKSLVTRMNYVEKKPGEVVIQQGDVGGSLFVIVRGEVRIVKELGAERVEVSRLGEGEFFGEMALVTDTPRVATVEAVTELDLLEVTRETLRLLIQDFPQVVPNLIKFLKDRLLEIFVKTSELLRPVPEKYRWQLARKFKLYEISEGKTILREGKPSGGMFIFLAGQAVATRQRRGKTVRLAEMGPGSLIGEISLLGGGAAVATVTAETKCWLLAVSQKQFEVLCQSYPQMRSFVEEIAEQRKRENAQLLSGDLSFVSQELRLV